MRCSAMVARLDRSIRGAAHTVVKKRSEIIDAIATEASPFDGATDKGSINDSLHLAQRRLPPLDPPPTSFL